MIEIGPLLPEDRQRWTELWRTYLDFYDTALSPEIYEHSWTRILTGEELRGLAAREDGEILGITHFLRHPSAWTLQPVVYLQDLFTDEKYRGRGVARALIEAVADEARRGGSTRMYWLTQSHNTTARLLYDRLAKHTGFIRYEYPL
ncbi:MAG: GNAT family N-acetyltransferase [Lysobacteraceae bacterium]|nr:MAG: GNAT family N-acetyltransferase [Xanthomonadaceae bacterium]